MITDDIIPGYSKHFKPSINGSDWLSHCEAHSATSQIGLWDFFRTSAIGQRSQF